MPSLRFSRRTRRDLRSVFIIAVAGSALAGVFSYLTADRTGGAFLQGLVDGFFISIALGVYVFFVSRRLLSEFFSRLNFSTVVLVDTLVYLVLFLGARFLGQLLTVRDAGAVARGFFPSNFIPALVLTFLVLFIINFLLQTNRLVGQNMLKSFILGTYHRPKEEARVFMFLDLESSTALTESLGDKKFHTFLRRFYTDLTDAVLETEGEIYKYVGDEVIITWKFKRGVRDANCVRCFFRIASDIRKNKERYRAGYGVVPAFRAGMHCGQVVAGEIGDIKREVAFLGDVLNTAARLEGMCKKMGERLIVSEALMNAIELPAEYESENLGVVQLEGKQRKLRVYAIRTRS